MRHITHQVDLCVVGGGLAGMCAAIAAARHGARVALMHDRPVLGGNASSEVRMWVCGAHGSNNRETGLIEEIELDNLRRNPQKIYPLWDALLYEKVRLEPNITLLLNCSCLDATMRGDRLASVRGWQGTAETWHTVEAALFADCSGDSILAPLSGAEYRIGREARGEFDESIEPELADQRTMGMSLLLQARQTDRPQPYTPPPWANVYASDENLPYRDHALPGANFWWIELGGEADSIHDTEALRDELLKAVYGVWDHVKNRGDHGADNWVLDWVGFLPGKRESRRYVGDYIVSQRDVEAGGPFDDVVAYAGWTMDDHHPAGLHYPGEPTIFHPAPSPWGIPYRSLYSRNVANLFCAGRNISTTHAALSSSRVMKTCALLGQAVGTAAAIAARHGLAPRGVYEGRLGELQQTLMDDDCWLPGHRRAVAALTREAALSASSGDPEPLRSGIDRPSGASGHGWAGAPGASWVEYRFGGPHEVREVRLVFDSDLARDRADHRMRCACTLDDPPAGVTPAMTRAFTIEVLDEAGRWHTVIDERDNHQRLVRRPLGRRAVAVRFTPRATWGALLARLFAWDVIG